MVNMSKEKEKAIREHSRGFRNAYREYRKENIQGTWKKLFLV